MSRKTYVPAAGSAWLLPFYDPFTKVLGVESAHRQLIAQAGISPGGRVLEIGCGTGNLAILAKRLYPAAEVVGIDPDPKALARARGKAVRNEAPVQFDSGFCEELPYPDGSFDRVLSAFMFHHLQPDAKKPALLEIRRVLRSPGSLHLVDFAGGNDSSRGLLAHLFHPSHGSRFHNTVLTLMQESGFAEAREVAQQAVILGRIAYYRASVSASSVPSTV